MPAGTTTCRTVLLVLAAVLGVLAFASGPAGATTLPAAGTPARAHLVRALATARAKGDTSLSFEEITAQPLRSPRGQAVQITTLGCGAGQDLSITYSARHGDAALEHGYAGALDRCHLNSRLSAGSLAVRWSTALSATLALRAQRPPKIRRQELASKCFLGQTTAHLIGTGRVDVNIHAAALGQIRRSTLTLTVSQTVFPNCAFDALLSGSTEGFGTFTSSTGASDGPTLQQLLNADQFQALWGANESISALAGTGLPTELSFTTPAKDAPAPQVQATFAMQLEAHGAFTPAPDLSSASLNFASPVSTGTLSFTAGIGCPPAIRAQDGRLTGGVTIDDPVLGKVHIAGIQMGQAQLSVVASQGDRCAPAQLGVGLDD